MIKQLVVVIRLLCNAVSLFSPLIDFLDKNRWGSHLWDARFLLFPRDKQTSNTWQKHRPSTDWRLHRIYCVLK